MGATKKQIIMAEMDDLIQKTNSLGWIKSYIKGRYQMTAVEANAVCEEWKLERNIGGEA